MTAPVANDSSTAFSSTVSEAGGDSGMPYVHESGKALGINATCVCGANAGYYPTVDYLLRYLTNHRFHLRLLTTRERPV